MKNLLAVLLAAAFAITASVVEATERSVVSTVSRVIAMGNGVVYLTLNTDYPACTNTASPRRYFAAVGGAGMTADGLKLVYAAALAAVTSGKSVSIYFDDSTPDCYITRILIQD